MDNSVQSILTKTAQFFKNKEIENPRLEAELLLSGALKWERIQLYLKFDQPLKKEELDLARDWVKRRAQGEPLAYITGCKYFYKRPFLVNPSVLIPRPESETAIEWALSQLAEVENPRILDIGTGSGCLGLSLLAEVPSAQGVLIDKSETAIETAKSNARQLDLGERARFVASDFLAADMGEARFDLIIANPPYLAEGDPRVEKNVIAYEPHTALFADDAGFACVRTWSSAALPFLRSGGRMIFEIGLDQDKKAVQHFQEIGLVDVGVVPDLEGVPRFVQGRSPQ